MVYLEGRPIITVAYYGALTLQTPCIWSLKSVVEEESREVVNLRVVVFWGVFFRHNGEYFVILCTESFARKCTHFTKREFCLKSTHLYEMDREFSPK